MTFALKDQSRNLSLLSIVAFFVSLVSAGAQANSLGTIVRISGNGQYLDWPIQSDWKWSKNASGAVTAHLRVTVQVPDDVSDIKPISSTIHAHLVGRQLEIQTGALHGLLSITKAGATANYRLDVTPPKPALFVANCSDLGLTITARPRELPIFIGARCVHMGNKAQGSNQLHLTIPEEADIDESTLFEEQGKGEPWRIYQLGNVDAVSSQVAKIVVRFEDKSYELQLTWAKKGKQAPEKKPFDKNFAVGLGYSMLSVQGAATGSSSQFLMRIKLLPTPLGAHFGFGADLDSTFGLSQSANSISHLQFAPYAYYRAVQTGSFLLDPRLYYVISSDEQTSTGVGFHTSQIGVGLLAAYQIAEHWQSHLELMTESMGSKVIKAHDFLDFGLNQVNTGDQAIRWGAGVQMQTFKVQDATGLTYQFGQTSLYGLVLF